MSQTKYVIISFSEVESSEVDVDKSLDERFEDIFNSTRVEPDTNDIKTLINSMDDSARIAEILVVRGKGSDNILVLLEYANTISEQTFIRLLENDDAEVTVPLVLDDETHIYKIKKYREKKDPRIDSSLSLSTIFAGKNLGEDYMTIGRLLAKKPKKNKSNNIFCAPLFPFMRDAYTTVEYDN
jgi:hypothetical protein